MIASVRGSATLPALCRSPKTGHGERKNGPPHPCGCGIAAQSAAKAGHNNIKINPVFRGMVFADRIKIKRKIKIKNVNGGGRVKLLIVIMSLLLISAAKNFQPKENCA